MKERRRLARGVSWVVLGGLFFGTSHLTKLFLFNGYALLGGLCFFAVIIWATLWCMMTLLLVDDEE